MNKLRKRFGQREKIRGDFLIDTLENEKGLNCVIYCDKRRMMVIGHENGSITFWNMSKAYEMDSSSFESAPSTPQQSFDVPDEEIDKEESMEIPMDTNTGEEGENEEVVDNDSSQANEEIQKEENDDEIVESEASGESDFIQLKKIPAHQCYVSELLMLTDGSLISCGGDSDIKRWSLDTFELIYEKDDHEQVVTKILQIDDEKFVTCSMDTKVIIWKIDDGSVVHILEGHSKSIYCMTSISLNGIQSSNNRIITGAADGTVKIWSVEKAQCIRTLHQKSEMVTQVVLDKGFKNLFVGCNDGSVTVWKVATCEKLQTYLEHKKPISCLEFNGLNVFSGSLDCTVKCWHSESTTPLREYKKQGGIISVILIKGSLMFSASNDGIINCFEYKTGKLKRIFNGISNESFKKLFIIGNKLVTTSTNSKIKIFSLKGLSSFLMKK